nr:MAG TPA: hypothetical protein [Caudoviricetes sp.]
MQLCYKENRYLKALSVSNIRNYTYNSIRLTIT